MIEDGLEAAFGLAREQVPIERRVGTDEYRFRLESRADRPSAALEVRYVGLVPDTFRSDAEIVASGRLTADGWLDVVPDGITAKCPSIC